MDIRINNKKIISNYFDDDDKMEFIRYYLAPVNIKACDKYGRKFISKIHKIIFGLVFFNYEKC